MSEAHKPLTVSRKSGSEVFHRGGQPIGCKILDFWSWAYSDYLGNTERGALAEFIVAADLGRTNQVRQGWNPFDIETSDGVKIEVKQSAYLQAWNQKKHSKIIFSIRPTHAWNFQTDVMEKDVRRQAACMFSVYWRTKILKHLIRLMSGSGSFTFCILPFSIIK